MDKNEPLSFLTYFPLYIKRLIPTLSMSKINNIKLTNNKLLIIKDYECLILEINIPTLKCKLVNTIYTKSKIKDASISLCDDS